MYNILLIHRTTFACSGNVFYSTRYSGFSERANSLLDTSQTPNPIKTPRALSHLPLDGC